MAKKSIKENQTEQPATVQIKPVIEAKQAKADGLLFTKENYIIMGIGLAIILIGFLLMAGGKSTDPNVFNADEIYSTRRITIAPIVVLIGFAVEAYAILKKPSIQ